MDKPKVTKPTKQAVREYLDRRTHSADPPPSIEEIRRQMGFGLEKHNDDVDLNDQQ